MGFGSNNGHTEAFVGVLHPRMKHYIFLVQTQSLNHKLRLVYTMSFIHCIAGKFGGLVPVLEILVDFNCCAIRQTAKFYGYRNIFYHINFEVEYVYIQL